MACFRCNTTENFIFLLKYRQRKVDLNTSKKSLVFVTIRHLYVQLSYTKISYLRKNTHLRKDAAFLHFRLKESSENMIFPWNGNIRKLTKIWSFLPFSQILVRRKFKFSCSYFHAVSTLSSNVLRVGYGDRNKECKTRSLFFTLTQLPYDEIKKTK